MPDWTPAQSLPLRFYTLLGVGDRQTVEPVVYKGDMCSTETGSKGLMLHTRFESWVGTDVEGEANTIAVGHFFLGLGNLGFKS